MADTEAPKDWMDLADWDRYWSETLADDFWRKARINDWSYAGRSYLESVGQREGHRVLLAGNGISAEPYAFAHAGCDVTAVEVSAVACQFLASIEVTPQLLAPMFPVYDDTVLPNGFTVKRLNVEKSCDRVTKEKRPGGRLSIVCEDLFRYEPEKPFHVIFSTRAYQGFPPDRCQELARRFYRWLEPGGIAFIEMLNIRGREPLEDPFRAAGFQEAESWSQAASGARQVAFVHGSG